MNPAGTCSGASVTSSAPCRGAVEHLQRPSASAARMKRRIVDAGFLRGQKRSLQMKPKQRGLRIASRPAPQRSRRRSFPAVGDQGQKKAGGAELAMRRRDRGDRLGARRIIEQDVAAAIDLEIDEAGREPEAVRQRIDERHSGDFRPWDDLRDPRAVDHDGGMPVARRAVEDVVRRDGESSARSSGPGHLLQVTRADRRCCRGAPRSGGSI